MPSMHRGSVAEAFEAWILNDEGEPADLFADSSAISARIYNPSTGAEVIAPWAAVALAGATGDGSQPDDLPNVRVPLAAVAGLAVGRYRLEVTATVNGQPLIRTWPFVVRPG